MNEIIGNENIAADRKWWKEAVVYQIYPRSFQDSNGDGIGDLNGITSRLDYIKSLGIDVVWLGPIFSSPNDDNGYDISDYCDIMKEFGTMEDFDNLLRGLHQRGIKLLLDLVVNHSSDEHKWFIESKSSRDNPYRNFYHWWPAENGKPSYRYSFFDVNSDAWKYDETTHAYYLHYFSVKQPDLNWENPQVREEIYTMMKFWLDKGIDGFRMDVIPFISKDTTFPDLPERYYGNYVRYYAEGPNLHKYLQEMNSEVLSKYDIMSVAEGVGVTSEEALNFVDPDLGKLNMLYHFDTNSIGLSPYEFKAPDPNGFSLIEFKDVFTRWDNIYAEKGWGTVYLGNHDYPRMLSRWASDGLEFRDAASKMLTTFLLTMRATPYYYAGDEIGMSNIKFDNIEDYRDIETINMYAQIAAAGGDLQRFLENQKITARDNARTPFQWDKTENSGFSIVKPWLNVNPNYMDVNVAVQEADPSSILNHFRKLIALRKQEPTLIYGKYILLDRDNPDTYAYKRVLGDVEFAVLLNFKSHEARVNIDDIDETKFRPVISNYPPTQSSKSLLRPFEASVYKL